VKIKEHNPAESINPYFCRAKLYKNPLKNSSSVNGPNKIICKVNTEIKKLFFKVRNNPTAGLAEDFTPIFSKIK
jgi:hypothetical protein